MLHHTKQYKLGGGHHLTMTQAQVAGFRVVHEVQPRTGAAQGRDVWYVHPDCARTLPLPQADAIRLMKRTWGTLAAMHADLQWLRKEMERNGQIVGKQ